MGLDLSLLPALSPSPISDSAHDLLDCHREETMFDIIETVSQKYGIELAEDEELWTYEGSDPDGNYEEPCYAPTYEDKYGNRLRAVLAGRLSKALAICETESWKNRAIIAYINELPDELRVWIYWK